MKIPVSWLKDFVDLENITVNRLCEALVSVGFEVEEVIELGREISNVVVGEIISMEKHPDADKLKVCRVDVGKEVLQIVTAATNVKTGDKIPLALNGATLAGGTVIKNGKLRGVASNGMMCGGEELGICEDQYAGASVDGVLILEQNAEVGRDIKEIVGLDECVIDVAVTFNRPDCNSVVGIAREAAVALGRKFTPPETDFETVEEISTRKYVNVDVRDAELCPAYFMQAAEVQIEPSPLWMRRRLHAAGLRGINNIVDVTNYVLLEVGQPMHAFDYKEISDKTIVVRRARKGETIIPLNEKEYGLDENILVIADKSRPVGLAGVMGGLNSGIKPDTSTVLLEAAEFNRENIRRTSRKLGIRSDSSARFEKGVDSYTAHLGLMRALHLISKLKCGRIAADTIESLSHEIKEREIKFHYSRVKNLLGIDIPQSESKKILENLGIKTVFEGQTLMFCAGVPSGFGKRLRHNRRNHQGLRIRQNSFLPSGKHSADLRRQNIGAGTVRQSKKCCRRSRLQSDNDLFFRRQAIFRQSGFGRKLRQRKMYQNSESFGRRIESYASFLDCAHVRSPVSQPQQKKRKSLLV